MSFRGGDYLRDVSVGAATGGPVGALAAAFISLGSQLFGGGGSPPPVLRPSDKRALEAAGYNIERRGRAKGPVVVSPTGQVYRGRQELKDLRAMIRAGQLTPRPTGSSSADTYRTPVWAVAPIIAAGNAAGIYSAIWKRWRTLKGRVWRTKAGKRVWEAVYDTRTGQRIIRAKNIAQKYSTRPAVRIARRVLPKVLEGAAKGARGGGWGVAIAAGTVATLETIEALKELAKEREGIPEWEDIRVTAKRLPEKRVLPLRSSPPPSAPGAPRPRLPGRSTSVLTRPTASPALEEIRVTAKRIPVPAPLPTTPGPLPTGPAPKPKWLQALEVASSLYRQSSTRAAVPSSRSILNVSQVPALQTQPLTWFQQPAVGSKTKTCECKPKRKRTQPTCRNPVVRRTKRNVEGRELITVTRELKCPPSSRKKRP